MLFVVFFFPPLELDQILNILNRHEPHLFFQVKPSKTLTLAGPTVLAVDMSLMRHLLTASLSGCVCRYVVTVTACEQVKTQLSEEVIGQWCQ